MKNLMRTGWAALVAWGMSWSAMGQGFSYTPMEIETEKGVSIEDVKDMGSDAITETVMNFMEEKTGEGYDRFLVLPFPEDVDRGYFTRRFQGAFSAKGKKHGYELYSRNETVFSQILKEVTWSADFGDLINDETKQVLKTEGVDAILWPRLSLSTEDEKTTLRIEMLGYVVGSGKSGKTLGLEEDVKRVLSPPINLWKWVLPILVLLIVGLVILMFLRTLASPRGRG